MEHLVFMLHYVSFAYAVSTINLAMPGVLKLIGLAWILCYLMIALRRNYGQSWLKTAVVFVLFHVAYMSVVFAGVFATLILTAGDL